MLKGGVGVRSGIKFATWKFVKCYSEMSYYTGNDLEQEEESDGSDIAWDTTNEEGASLDQSLMVLGTGQGTASRAPPAGRGQTGTVGRRLRRWPRL